MFELLPGLVLLLALMMVVGSLGALVLEGERRARAQADLVHALGYAGPAWGQGEARAALVARTGDGWEVSVFPERSWLPGPVREGGRGAAYRFCRRRVGYEDGCYWEVGRCGVDGEEFLAGEVLARIRIGREREDPDKGEAR